MSTVTKTQLKRHRCRQTGCPNTYVFVLGGDMAFGRHYQDGECIPCFYAALLLEYGLTPERVENSEQMMEMFLPHLDKMGWTWNDVRDSYQRHPVVM